MNEPEAPYSGGDAAVARVLGVSQARRWRRLVGRVLAVLGVAAALALVVWWQMRESPAPAVSYETKPVETDDLRVTVTSTGTLNALNTVEVGAEITGRVLEVDVEFNDEVTVGQVLAKIETATYEARVEEAQARLQASYASLKNAQATAKEAELKAERTKRLHGQGLVSDQDLEAAEAAYERAQASIKSNAAQNTLNQASLKVAQSDVAKTIILSPIDGVVLDRKVEPGQTVTSGMQTPVLFVLATDLEAMRLEISVDEADVGMVAVGQPATFTVDAYPDQDFSSKVLAVKNMPTTDSTVVTYEAWLAVDNTKRLLRPGMTATAHIIVKERQKVLLVPNAALRFVPPEASEGSGFNVKNIMPGPRRFGRGKRSGGSDAGSPAGSAQAGSGEAERPRQGRRVVWVLDENGNPRRVPVQVGATDGTRTEVRSKELSAGTKVIVNATTGSQ